MSLVNEMLRDLEIRRASSGERPQLDDLFAVDEAGAARRIRRQRLKRSLVWFAALCLIAALVGMMIGRVFYDYSGVTPPATVASLPQEAPAPVAPPVVEPQVGRATAQVGLLPSARNAAGRVAEPQRVATVMAKGAVKAASAAGGTKVRVRPSAEAPSTTAVSLPTVTTASGTRPWP